MTKRNYLSIVLVGSAGQGIQTVEKGLATLLKKAGYAVFTNKEYMSRVRGGVNSTQLIVSSTNRRCFHDTTDVAVLFTPDGYEHIAHRLQDSTVVLADASLHEQLPESVTSVPFLDYAKEAGSKLYQNSVAIGLIAGLLSLKKEALEAQVTAAFAAKGESVQKGNREAAQRGYEEAQGISLPEPFPRITPGPYGKSLFIGGSEALGLGAIAGGCSFICSYPMSPGTGLLTTLAKYSHTFNIAVEQVEDEIAAVNMAAGAWYAGARTVVTTSGGGFALMTEGISLAGIMELPLVVNISMRPGPATGLPTRTEQGDLNLAVYAGHGEFPRIVYAPRDTQQGFDLAKRAMEDADACQVPVILLTDQYFMDGMETLDQDLDTHGYDTQHIVETDPSYKRYALGNSVVSPRGIPGYGTGIVCCDSDEHTEEGYITESMSVRCSMMDKRMAKHALCQKRIPAPELLKSTARKKLLVSWGTNYHVVRHALEEYDGDDIDFLHFSCVYPLPENLSELLSGYDVTAVLENNYTAQFARLIRGETGHSFDTEILQYDGQPFSVEHVTAALKNLGKEEQ
ncbi:2-oxoacid:acceptor oxidoreductase subunit alpha [Chitinivibrio alkaliphilus]|uniref:2-oxoglutarate:ferredoxin oxidoreductase, alpha subunit n=1 Tax=Chitinivibrio alkaliphilus ACht1 TaxID=1313304 RepID=U7D4U1_9BACT|nr:2-oxoacid:acceptor oxidoreductase subunit alpha [Chitinivibrio alkaliphilus]ERP30958.1 2-oxoglutarate:ferredoxin oxidoreductase, alpha subunit [Chitinivibrio alkaliphilus ACht1]